MGITIYRNCLYDYIENITLGDTNDSRVKECNEWKSMRSACCREHAAVGNCACQ